MKRQIGLLLLLTLFFSASAFGADKPLVLRFNTVAGPQQPEVKGLEVFAKEADRLSGGKIKVRIYHSGQLGNQQTQLTGVMRGTLEMTFTDPNSLAQFDEKIGVLGAAYLFRDIEHMNKVMSGAIGKEYFERLAKAQGVRPLSIWYLGTRQLNLANKSASTPEEMKGVKLRMPNSRLWVAMGRALGAQPTPVGFGEIYLSLKTGVVDGQDNPLPTDKAQKFYEVTKYIILTNHQLGMIWPSINEKIWQEMPVEYRRIIQTALETARDFQNRLVLEEEKALLEEFKKKYGMVIIRADIDAFRKNASKVYEEFDREWDGMYRKIQAIK